MTLSWKSLQVQQWTQTWWKLGIAEQPLWLGGGGAMERKTVQANPGKGSEHGAWWMCGCGGVGVLVCVEGNRRAAGVKE